MVVDDNLGRANRKQIGSVYKVLSVVSTTITKAFLGYKAHGLSPLIITPLSYFLSTRSISCFARCCSRLSTIYPLRSYCVNGLPKSYGSAETVKVTVFVPHDKNAVASPYKLFKGGGNDSRLDLCSLFHALAAYSAEEFRNC